MREAFVEVTKGIGFDVFSNDSLIELKFEVPNRGWVNAHECGLGLQDLVVMLYFAIASDFEIVCIEEPESHLHPEMQKAFIRQLRRITAKQFVVATHSSAFVSPAAADRVYLCRNTDGGIVVTDDTNRAEILADLGYEVADNLVSDVVILVEGPTDIPVLEELLAKSGTLEKYSVKLWPLGGDIMKDVDVRVIAERAKVIAIVDNDPGSAAARRRFIEHCKQAGVPVTQLGRYAIVNYFTVAALRAVFKAQIPESLASIAADKKLVDQIHIDVKRNNRKIARAMSLEDVAKTDLGQFLRDVAELCDA